MPGGLIAGGLGIGAAVIGAKGAKDAAKIQAQGARDALGLQREMFDTARADLGPYREVGESALYSLASLYGLPTPNMPEGGAAATVGALDAFRASPEYQFPLNEGLKAIEYSRAAKGQLQNPGTMEEMTRYATGYAGSRLDGYLGRLLQIAGIGGNAASAGAGQAMAFGQQAGQTTQDIAAAQASGVAGQTNAIVNALGAGAQNMALYGFMNPRGDYSPTAARPMISGPAPSYPSGYSAMNYPLSGSVPIGAPMPIQPSFYS